ncbi:hypothetical protein RCL_jg17218.t1 [Rhizophagus clarus]|uniref:Uncharacterized protein n=1 Tax=Rhizophagus clarus TaxID=94130 RepID=A0A8H3R1U2_9GLOM|nr:hypothetical protein RCL_jg17218.t1 [Rhizophagus clarus]
MCGIRDLQIPFGDIWDLLIPVDELAHNYSKFCGKDSSTRFTNEDYKCWQTNLSKNSRRGLDSYAVHDNVSIQHDRVSQKDVSSKQKNRKLLAFDPSIYSKMFWKEQHSSNLIKIRARPYRRTSTRTKEKDAIKTEEAMGKIMMKFRTLYTTFKHLLRFVT